jgi:hypothetical protein
MLEHEVQESLRVDWPKGFYIGDPCYILPDVIYQGIWENEYSFFDGAIYYNDKQNPSDPNNGKLIMVVASTAYGDGCYLATGTKYENSRVGFPESFNVPVDAGVIAIVNLEFAKSAQWHSEEDWRDDELCTGKNGEGFSDETPVSGVRFGADTDGNFEIKVTCKNGTTHDFYISTGDEEEDEYDDDYFEEEEDPYGEEYENEELGD